jgi:hypothetical protein
MDYQMMNALFTKEQKLPMYTKIENIEINPDSTDLTLYRDLSVLKFNCRVISNRLADYSKGY